MKNKKLILFLEREINLHPRIKNAFWYHTALIGQGLPFLALMLFLIGLFSPLLLLGIIYGFGSIIFAPIGKKKEVFKKSFRIFSKPIGRLLIFIADFFLRNSDLRERIISLDRRMKEHEKRERK